MPTRFLIIQCQIIIFIILKSDIIENSRIELRGIVLPVPSKQIKVAFIIILQMYLSTWYICDFFLFHIEIEGKGGCIMGGGGGAKGMFAPLSNSWGGGGWPPWHPLFLRLWIMNLNCIEFHRICDKQRLISLRCSRML